MICKFTNQKERQGRYCNYRVTMVVGYKLSIQGRSVSYIGPE